MEICLVTVVSMMFIILAVKQIVNYHKIAHPNMEKSRCFIYINLASLFGLICCSLDSDTSCFGIPFIILLSLTSVFLLSLSVVEYKTVRWYVIMTVAVDLLSGLWCLLSWRGLLPSISVKVYLLSSVVFSGIVISCYISSIYVQLRNIKLVVRSGSVWKNITLGVDSVYLSLIISATMINVSILYIAGELIYAVCVIQSMIYSSLYVALGVRILNSSVFVLMTEHERKIIESMKISNVDTHSESPGTALLYKGIYDRVVDYFTEYKPYLNNNLTINDVVEVVFSNKLYISRAISQFTGRNFCQFVNYYRIIHAIELFRSDTDLKIQELSSRSGFNSPVSFGMAFRLYMGEKPGDWLRKEKYRLEKQKK